MDVEFESAPEVEPFGISTRTCHERKTVNALYADGHASVFDNRDRTYTVVAITNIQHTLRKILANFEKLDVLD
jgi:prepilin-type processing-associated H-X9-DG protein